MPSAADTARNDFELHRIYSVLGRSPEYLQAFVASSEVLDQKGRVRQNSK